MPLNGRKWPRKPRLTILKKVTDVSNILRKIAASTKLRQSRGAHRRPGLSGLAPLLGSYLSGKVEFGCISAHIWLPDTVLHSKVDCS